MCLLLHRAEKEVTYSYRSARVNATQITQLSFFQSIVTGVARLCVVKPRGKSSEIIKVKTFESPVLTRSQTLSQKNRLHAMATKSFCLYSGSDFRQRKHIKQRSKLLHVDYSLAFRRLDEPAFGYNFSRFNFCHCNSYTLSATWKHISKQDTHLFEPDQKAES